MNLLVRYLLCERGQKEVPFSSIKWEYLCKQKEVGGGHSVGLNGLPNINFLNLKAISGTHLSDDQTTEELHWKLYKQDVMETF